MPAYIDVAYQYANAEKVDATGTAAQGAVFASGGILKVSPDVDCYVSIGTNPTATSTDGDVVFAGSYYHYKVNKGERISVLRKGTTDGVCAVALMSA